MVHKRNNSNNKLGKKTHTTEPNKTLVIGKNAIKNNNQSRIGGKKKMIKTLHEEYSNTENCTKKEHIHEISASADVKKVIAFLHSPSSLREKVSEPSNLPETIIEWTSTKGKNENNDHLNNGNTDKSQSRTERTIPAAFMKRSKANNIVTHARTLEGAHNNSVTCMCTSEGSLWSGSKDRSIVVWDYKKKSPGQNSSLRVHTGAITSMCKIPRSGQIATGSEDHHVRIWDSLKRTVLGSFRTKNSFVSCLVPKDPTQIFCGCSNHRITVNN